MPSRVMLLVMALQAVVVGEAVMVWGVMAGFAWEAQEPRPCRIEEKNYAARKLQNLQEKPIKES